ncbi:Tetratricopeptide-like helical domain superfamily [Sesbania bispinosa]|nr:Tetratricopeptide-like helical domain superfamily [Sesbania bispinosa]
MFSFIDLAKLCMGGAMLSTTHEMFDVQCHRGIQELVSSNSTMPGYMCASDAHSGYMRALYVRQNPVSNSALMLFDEMTQCVSPAVSLLNILPATAPMDDSLLRKEAHDFSVGTGSVMVPFMATDSFVWTNMCKFTTNARLGPPLENGAGVFSDTGWYATNQFNVDVIFGNRMKQYECLTHDSYNATAIFVPFYAGFAFILAVAFRMEQLDWNSSSSLAKSLGTVVSIDGAFILTLYKGHALLMGLSPENSSQQSVSSQNSNWILGELFLVVNYVMVVAFQLGNCVIPVSHEYTTKYLQNYSFTKVDVLLLEDVPKHGAELEGVDIPSDVTGNPTSCAEMATYLMLGLLCKQNEMQIFIQQKKLGSNEKIVLVGSVSAIDPGAAIVFLTFMVDELLEVFRVLNCQNYFKYVEGYNVMVSFLCNAGRVKEGYAVLQEMKKKGICPNVESYNYIMEACCKEDMLRPVLCYQFKVGDLDAWGLPTSGNSHIYDKWSKYHNLHIGDSLLFLYPPSQDSVIQVTEESYKSCNLKDPILYMNNGNSLFNITSEGDFYFTSGEAGHCQKNQKLHILVGNGTGNVNNAYAPTSLPAYAPSYPTVFGTIPVSPSSSHQLYSNFPLVIVGFLMCILISTVM